MKTLAAALIQLHSLVVLSRWHNEWNTAMNYDCDTTANRNWWATQKCTFCSPLSCAGIELKLCFDCFDAALSRTVRPVHCSQETDCWIIDCKALFPISSSVYVCTTWRSQSKAVSVCTRCQTTAVLNLKSSWSLWQHYAPGSCVLVAGVVHVLQL